MDINTAETPNQGLLTSSEVYRIDSTASKVGDAFDHARREARDECLWLSAVCHRLLADNNRLRIENERQRRQLEKQAPGLMRQ